MVSEVPRILSADGQRLLARRLAGAGVHAAPERRRARTEPGPLSADQRRLWFIDQVAPGNVAYNVAAAYRLRGPLDVVALRSAVRLVLDRHDVLRARFTVVAGEPCQVAGDLPDEVLHQCDLSTERDPVASAGDVARTYADEPFVLTGGPLFRAWLARLGDDDHAAGIVVHHIVFDRESLDLWQAEVSVAYRAACADQVSVVPPLPAGYAEFVDWQRSQSTEAALAAQRDYWRERLRGVPVLLDLPADRPRPAKPTHRAGQVAVHVPASSWDELRELASAHRTTVFAVALAGFQALLLRYTPGTGRVAVGCPVNGRARAEFEALIGFFVKSLPIVADVSDGRDPAFVELVTDAREALLAAHANQDVPFDEIVRLVAPPRDLGHNPVFQIWFDLVAARPDGRQGLDLPGVTVGELETDRVRARFDLELHLVESADGGLSGRLQFATDLYDRDTAARFVRHYQNLIAEVAANPSVRLSEISLLDTEEQKTIINEWGTAR